jgi:hypothetical protein
MANYAHVEDGVVGHMGGLPNNWRNLSGLNKSDGDDSFLKTLGFLPLVEVPATLGANDVSTGWTTSITASKVTNTEGKRAMTAAEKTDRTNSEALQEIIRLEELETPRRLAEALPDESGGSAEGRTWFKANRGKIAVERAKMINM